MNYLVADNLHYRALIDSDTISETDMTDDGTLVTDLRPIGDAMLCPGDPSPVGRNDAGDLVYVVRKEETWMRLQRSQAAYLASLHAKAAGITRLPEYPLKDQSERLLIQLLEEALPQVFFVTAHEKLSRAAQIEDILSGKLDSPPETVL